MSAPFVSSLRRDEEVGKNLHSFLGFHLSIQWRGILTWGSRRISGLMVTGVYREKDVRIAMQSSSKQVAKGRIVITLPR
ncbi:hypothetical protein Tco_0479486 [Tanacetum coccineum]